ncbi:hypothetical protein G6F17_008731 [Rhizopus arrhizus]|nr:hypothetical protein G6F22_009653 [Rhizopus arrhizus]KAG0828882.1 hypothetical protein G6F18_008852 [Rhizopus arrhizus]KAG0851735.1 hypothetical protein G6F17_008731 [Rhizopus arrhizus]KAG1185035.1 hypothetical protein G6F36_007240 [Rhizopus arrhizus]
MDLDRLKQNTPLLLPACLALLSTLYLLKSSRSTKEKEGMKEIPYPRGSINWPIFGHMLSLGNCPSSRVTQWHNENGPIIKINMGKQLWVMISDPLLAHEFFVKAGKSTSSRPHHRFSVDILSRYGRGIAFAPYTPKWKGMRKIAVSLFAPESLQNYINILEEEADHLMDRLGDMSGDGKALDCYKHLQLASLNFILRVTAATRLESVEDPTFQSISDLCKYAMIYSGVTGDLVSYIPSLAWIDRLKGTREKMEALISNQRDPIVSKLIEEAMEKEDGSVIKELYEMKEKGTVDEDDIYVFMFGGSDPITVALYWTLAILSQQPQVQENLIKELDAWKARNSVDAVPHFYQDIDQFPYMLCVQKEVQRFRPGNNFGIPRMTTDDVTVQGYFVPKGSMLLSSMWTMHQNKAFYGDPEHFRPERYMDGLKKISAAANARIEERDHFGFGWGRRICPGIHLSEIQFFNFYVRFFSKFTVVPDLDSEGNLMPVDLNHIIEEGIVSKPMPYKIRILPRT